MQFGPVTQIFYLPQIFFSGPHFRHCVDTLSIITNHLSPFGQVLYIKNIASFTMTYKMKLKERPCMCLCLRVSLMKIC